MEKSIFRKQRRAPNKRALQKTNEIRAAFYIRVSTEEQAENPEGSIKNQEERLNFALQMRSSDVMQWHKIGVYCDAGKSGKDMNRSELRRLLDDIESGKINMLMVSELSRLTRSTKDFSELWEFLQANRCGFLSLRENFDTSTAAGEMMLYQIANFAQFERKQTSERVSANFEARAKRGLWNGGVIPLGYEVDPENRGCLRICEEEAASVRAAFQAVIIQGTLTSAARWLNESGIPYCGSNPRRTFRPRLKHFVSDNLRRLIINQHYIGIRRFKTKEGFKEVKGAWTPIIDQKTFEHANQILAAVPITHPNMRNRYPYLLSALVYCEQCGQVLIGRTATSESGKKIGYYEHSTQIRRESTLAVKSPKCATHRIPAKKIEERTWNEILDLLKGENRHRMLQAIQALNDQSPERKHTSRIEKERDATTLKLRVLAERLAELPEGIPTDAIYAEMKRLQEAKVRLEEEVLASLRETPTHEPVTPDRYAKLLNSLAHTMSQEPLIIGFESKRRIIQALIHKAVVFKSGLKLMFYAGSEQMRKGEALASPLESFKNLFSTQSSILGLNGGR